MENFSEYEDCSICPRKCKINRKNSFGFCKESDELKIAAATIHFGEEPPITVLNGSGTIFVTGCNLHCAFCQNYQISQNGMGKTLSVEEFSSLCLKMQDEERAENINIVTGSHAIPFFAKALRCAKENGLKIPVCWNSSAYETVESLEMLKGLVDIWLPDMKTLNPIISEEVFKAKDYPSVCKKAIRWMIENSPLKFERVKSCHSESEKKRFGDNKIEKMTSGVIIRHLVLPGRINDTLAVLDWLKSHADKKACISLMSQYTPVNFSESELEKRKSALNCFQHRLMNKDEFKEIQNLIYEYDFSHLFYQELTEDTDWLPDFNNFQPFSNELSRTIWHWKS